MAAGRIRFRDWAPGVALMSVALPACVAVAAAPRQAGAVAALYPPWWSQAQILSAAGAAGRIASGGGAPFVIALRSDQPGLAERARAHGAWLVMDQNPLSACTSPGEAP